MLDTSQAKEFALAHWLTSGASGGRLFVRVFDGAGNVREDIAGDVLASITTMQWNGPAKGWNAGAPVGNANFNRRQTIRAGASVAYAQVGVIGFDGLIDLQSLRLYRLRELHVVRQQGRITELRERNVTFLAECAPVTSVNVVEKAGGLEVAMAQATLGGSCWVSLVVAGLSISPMASTPM